MTGLPWIRVAMLGVLALAPSCCFDLRAQADFRTDVNLVVLHVTVVDHEGHFIQNLPKAAFQIYEDGVPQQITLFRHEDAPVAVGLIVDNNGSMRRKVPDVIAAADMFAQSSNTQDQMFIVNFNECVSLGLPSSEAFVSNPNELRAAMMQIHARGETALYDAIDQALAHIDQSMLQKKVLIVLSDGGDNASVHRFPEVLMHLEESNVIVYTVGLFDQDDRDRNPGVLRKLARVSGGEAFFPSEIPAVTSVLQEVSRDIRNQYTIAYVPSNDQRDGTYRTIHIKLTGPLAGRWTVRGRTGYVATGPATAAGAGQALKEQQ